MTPLFASHVILLLLFSFCPLFPRRLPRPRRGTHPERESRIPRTWWHQEASRKSGQAKVGAAARREPKYEGIATLVRSDYQGRDPLGLSRR
eukprot:782862-Pyramimonas_sp.AAC.1